MTLNVPQSAPSFTPSAITADHKGFVVLGIDPGLNGALAFVHTTRGIIDVVDMPTHSLVRGGKYKREIDAHDIVQLIELQRPLRAYMELVNSTPQMGVTSAFTFGEGKGVLKGVLAALYVPTTFVTPQTWQREMAVRKGKDAARARAAELFPHDAERFQRVKDDGRADAALIAAWGIRNG